MPGTELWTFRFARNGSELQDRSCLYLIEPEECGDLNLGNDISAIVVTGGSDACDAFEPKLENCICIEGYDSWNTVVKGLSELFSEQYDIGRLIAHLQELVRDNRGLAQMVDTIADFVQLPVSVLDNTFRFLARSTNFVPDMARPEARLINGMGGLPTSLLDTLEEQGTLKDITGPKEFSHIHLENDSAYFAPIMVNNTRAGYLAIYEDALNPRSLGEELAKYLPMIAMPVGFELSKNDFYAYNKGSYFTYILSLLAENDGGDVEDVRGRLRIFDYELRRNIYLVHIDIPRTDLVEFKRVDVAASLNMVLRNSIYVQKGTTLLFLVSRDDADKIRASELDIWDKYLSINHLKAGVAGPFSELGDFRQKMRAAELAMAAGSHCDPERSIFLFSDHRVDVMIEQVAREMDIRAFRHPGVMKLVEYDAEHGTELVQTLQAYITSPKMLQRICEQLHVHKNTLYKRLQRIRDVSGIDYDDADEVVSIEITLRILQMSGD